MGIPVPCDCFNLCEMMCVKLNLYYMYSGGDENVNCKVRDKLISGTVVFEQDCTGILNATAFKDFWLTW